MQAILLKCAAPGGGARRVDMACVRMAQPLTGATLRAK